MEATAQRTEQGVANPKRWLVLGVMSLSAFMVFMDNTIVNTALPAISKDLKASTSTLQWVVDSYTLVLAGLLLLGGAIGDRFGRRRLMIAGMVIFGVASASAAFAGSAEVLIALRGLQGVGAALVMPATLSILTDVFPRGERAKAIGIWTAASGLAIGMGPALGGYVVDQFDWSAVFLLHIPIVAAALIGLLLVVPESKDPRQRRLDVPGGLLATGGLVALGYAIIRGGEAGWTSGQVVGAFMAALTLLAAFALVEARSAEPMLPLRFFRQRDFTGAVLVIGLIFFAMFVTFFFLTQFFQIVQGRSAFEAGLLIIVVSVGWMAGAPLSGLLVKRIGPRVLLIGANGLMIAGMFLLLQLGVDTGRLEVSLALLLFGIGGGLGIAPLTDTVMAAVPVNDAGVGSAINDVSRELGGALGVASVGGFVNGLYRSNVEQTLAGSVPEAALESAKEGVGVAALSAANLPPDVATVLTAGANQAFIDAVTAGFVVSIVVLIGAALVSLTLLPTRMRETQAELEEEEALAPTERIEAPVPALALSPVPVRAEVDDLRVDDAADAAG